MLISHILLSFYTKKHERKKITKQKSSTAVEALYNYPNPHNHLMWDVSMAVTTTCMTRTNTASRCSIEEDMELHLYQYSKVSEQH